MFCDFILRGFEAHPERPALVWRDREFRYRELSKLCAYWKTRLGKESVESGTIVSLEADFSPNSVALLLALVDHGCTVVPLTSSVSHKKPEFRYQRAEL